MSSAIDLLMSSQTETDLLQNESLICIIDPKTRIISVPSGLTIGGVESDKNSERLQFSCPKTVGDNLDLSEFQIRINFRNISETVPAIVTKDQYICEDVSTSGDNILFSWLLSRNAVKNKGILQFIVCAVKVNSDSEILIEWNTTLAQVEVLEGIEIEDAQPTESEKDVIAQLLKITKETSEQAVSDVNEAKKQALEEIETAKVLPRLDDDGVLIF